MSDAVPVTVIQYPADPFTLDAEAITAIVRDGISMTGCEPWKWYPWPTPERLMRAFDSMHGMMRDSMDWLGFMQECMRATSVFFESDTGWILAQGIKAGASADIHGGSFTGRRGKDEAIDGPTHCLLDAMIDQWHLKALNSSYPIHNKMAALWDKHFGFEKTGLLIAGDFWGGEARDVVMTSRFRRAPEGGSK